MFKRISIFLIVLSLLLTFTIGVGATAAGLFVEKDAGNTYINYVNADGTSIMKIDDTDGVTIATEVVANTYTSMTITNTTDASSLTVGSIVTPGGIACAKQLFLGDDLDMSVSGTGVYDITLKDTVADALSIVGGSTDMIVFCTDTDAITITPPLTVTGLITSNGGINVGASGAGFDVTFYGDEATADFFWDQNGDTYGSLTLGADTKGVDFKAFGTTTGNYLIWDRSADDLLLVGTATQLGVAGTTASTSSTTGSIHTAGGLGVAGAAFIAGVVEVGADAAGTDFTLYGDVTAYKTWWDANGDINGAWYFGADTKGVLVTLYGDTTGCGVFWNPSTDTNGTLSVGATGGSKGVDMTWYGITNGAYMTWDQSANSLIFVGTATNYINFNTVGSNASIALEFKDGFLGHSISTGSRGDTTDLGVTLTATNEFNAGFFADDSTANIADSVANVLARTVLLATQSAGSIRSVQGQLKIADAVDVGTGVYTAVQGYIELMGDTSVKTGGKMSCMDISLEIASGKTLTIDSGGIFAGLKIETTGAGTFTQTGTSAAIYIDDGGTVTDWKVGVDVNNCTTGIDIGSGTTGISMSGAYSTAAISISTTSAANDDYALYIATTCADGTGDTVPVLISSTMTTAGSVGQALKVNQSVATVALGSYVNAIYGLLTLGTTGSVSGLGAPICAEIVFNTGTVGGSGTLAGVEIEFTTGAATTMSGTVSALWIQTSGATTAVIDDNGYFARFTGFAAGAAHMWQTGNTLPAVVGGSIRIMVGATEYFIPVYTSVVTTT